MNRFVAAVAVLVLVVDSAHAQQPGTETAGLWRVSSAQSITTRAPQVVLQLTALNIIPPSDAELPPVLFVRCQDQRLEVFIGTDWVLEAHQALTAILLQWGAADPKPVSWGLSDDHRTAFSPAVRGFLAQLTANPDLSVAFRLKDHTARSALFDGRGLAGHMSTVDRACPPPAPDPAQRFIDSIRVLLASGQLMLEASVDQRPEVLEGPSIQYPPELRQARVSGRVVVQAILDTSGRVERESVRIIETPDLGFIQAARQYVLGARFRPARVKGRAVRVFITIPIDFNVR